LTFDDLASPCPVEAAEATLQEEKETGVDAETATANAANRLLNTDIPRKWGNEVVAYDDCSAAIGEWIALSEGAEAAAAFHPTQKPVDAFCGAILDTLVVDAEVVATLAAKK
jgi:microcompartment protein CcmK/EutM